MTKSKRVTAIIATVAAICGAIGLASVSQAKSNYYYQYYYYSDASHTFQVGELRQQCLNDTTIITPPVYGQMTAYYTAEIIGRCPGKGDW